MFVFFMYLFISLIWGIIFWIMLSRAVAVDTAIDAYDTAIGVAMRNCTRRCTMGHNLRAKTAADECVNEDAIYNNEDDDYEHEHGDVIFR